MATAPPIPPPRPRPLHRSGLAWALSVLVLLGAPRLDAHSRDLYLIQYALVSQTATADGTDYVFRARLFNIGAPVPGATATLTGASPAATVLDGTLTFGPVGRFGTAWSTDTAAIRRHGRWLDVIRDFRWVIDVATGNRAPQAAAGPDQTAALFDRVVLDGSASTDPDGDPLTYRWAFVSTPPGSAAVLADAGSVRPEFVVDAPGRYVVALVVNDGRQDSAPDVVEVSTANGAPIADAGPDQRLVLGAVAQLDGSGSTDPDGDPLTFLWQIVQRPAGSLAVLDDPRAVRPTFVADAAGTYVASLVVSDGQVASAPDTVELTTDNTRPIADAGPDQRVAVGQTVTLDGSGSTDVDGNPLTYAWALVSVPPGSAAALTAPTSVAPRFTADLPGAYVAQLVVNDGLADSDPDTVMVSTSNTRPVAVAGPDQTVTAGQIVTVDGSGSGDADGDPLSFHWTIVSAPAGSVAVLQDPSAAVTTFVADQPGDYALQLVVNDGQLDSVPDALVVSTVNSAPIADAGPDRTDVLPGALVVLDGSGSSDPDGQPLGYAWSLVSRPAGSAAALTDADTPGPSFVADVPGTYVAQLVVNDGFVDSAPDTVSLSTLNLPPTADAGPDQTVPAGATVQLDGGGSSDPEGAPLTVTWTLLTAPAGSTAALSDPAAVAPTFVADLPGQYTAQLVVDDGVQASQPDLVVITATAPLVTVDASDPQASEQGLDPGAFTLSRTGPVGMPLVVDIAIRGTAGNGIDYEAVGSSVTFAAGDAQATVAIVPIADADVEGAETVTLDLVAGLGYDVGAPSSALVTIADGTVPVVTLAANDPDASEAGDPGQFTVTRSGPITSALVVNLEVLGTATPGVDYLPLPATATIAAGAATAVIDVVPVDDAVFEASEGVTLRLLPGGAYLVGTPSVANVTITDDDTLVSVVASDLTASENGSDTAALTFSRAGDTVPALTVAYTVSGSATSAADYVALPGSVTFAPGATDAVVIVTPVDDALLEGPETVTLRLLPGPGYQVGVPDQGGVTILDDERPSVTITVSDGTAGEAGPDPGSFEVTRTGPTTSPLVVALSVGGAATEGVDYQSLGTSLTIPAGASSAQLAVVPIDDSLVEGAEIVTVAIAPGSDYAVVVPGIAALTITDDDLGAVTIDATDPDASEAGLDPGQLTLRRTGDVSAPLDVFLGLGGTVTNTDYEPIGVIVTIPAGAAALAVPVVPRADNVVEGPEQLVVTVLPRVTYVVGAPSSATVTIADDPMVVTLTASAPDAAEAGLVPGAFLLTRTGGNLAASQSVSVAIGGTGVANRDYVVLSGVVTFAAGQAAVTVPVVPLADNLVEGDDTVTMTLNPSVGSTYVVGTPASGTVTIADDPPIVDVLVVDPDASEAGLDPGVVQFRRSGGDTASALNVFFQKSGTATNGSDYVSLGGALSLVVIPAGQTTVTVSVVPVADNLVEPPETAILTLAASTGYVIGAADRGTVTIADDPPVVEIVATDPDASETGPDPGAFTVTRRGGNLAQALTVSFTRSGTATSSSDFVVIPSSLTIPAGQASAVLTITPVDDAVVEGPETVVLTINPSATVVVGASGTATVTIADND
ncbi:MAG: Calx-beta domain-containing protein [Vicinamibacterales bacterium]